LIHLVQEGRSPVQIGKKGNSNHRWIIGGEFCFILNQGGRFVRGIVPSPASTTRIFTP
jgi:hypothetical protein